MARNDIDEEKLDLDIGFSLTRPSNASVRIAGDLVLRASELPAVETMATIVRPGTNAASHTSFGAVGAGSRPTATKSRVPAAKSSSNRSPDRPASKARWWKSSSRSARPPNHSHFCNFDNPDAHAFRAMPPAVPMRPAISTKEKDMLTIHGVPLSVHTRKAIVTAILKDIDYKFEVVIPVIPGNPPPNWRRSARPD